VPAAGCDPFPPDRPAEHNVAVTYGQMGTVCPQCGNTDAVHSIQELATLARARLGQQGPTGPQPGMPAQPQPGTPAQPGWAAEPQAGWMAEPQAGPLPTSRGRQSNYPPRNYSSGDTSFGDSIGDDIAGAVLGAAAGAAARFLGRQASRRLQDRLTQQVQPAMAAKQQNLQTMLQTQIEIADRHPDLCACLNDQVIFLAGGHRTLPMPNLMSVTVEQADAMVARLRDG
jgi:hypothetical protein